MTQPAVLATLGFCIGLVGAAVGVGGGFFIVPFLLLIAHYTHLEAVSTSLAVVFLTAASATIFYVPQKKINYVAGLAFAAATIPGAVAGAYVTQHVSTNLFTLLFAGLLVVASLMLASLPPSETERPRTIRTGWGILRRTYTTTTGESFDYCIDLRFGMLASIAIGFFSSFFGVGGGLLHVPFMVLALGVPFRVAAATAHFILPLTTLAGFLALWSGGQPLTPATAWLAGGAVLGAMIGAASSGRARSRTLRVALAVILFLVAIRMALQFSRII